MNSPVKKSLYFLIGSSVLGVAVLLLFLPLKPGGIVEAISGLLFQLVFVMLGLGTTILMGSVFPPPLVFEVVIALGIFSVAIFSYGIKFHANKVSYAAIVLWVFVGSWSTFWGIAYGV